MRLVAVVAGLLLALSVAANFEIVIDKGTDVLTPIAVVPFNTLDGTEDVSNIVALDLSNSGQFIPVNPEDMLSLPTTPDEVIYRDWRVLNVEYVITGKVSRNSSGEYVVMYHVIDVNDEQVLKSGLVSGPIDAYRDIAHHVSDNVYETMTGVRGAFSTKLIYVLVENRGQENAVYRLELADVDGARARTLFRSANPILSPNWSPDGSRVTFVSFESGRSAVYVQDIASLARQVVANFEGVNSAPAFSPDGTTLALALSRDGNPEIYTLNLETAALRRITDNRAIDTEPIWTGDGSELIFTSDRGGKPQIYKVSLRSLFPERITFDGDYNARPRLLPDNKHLIFVHRAERTYHIAWQQLSGDKSVRMLTSNILDESPSIAPNGTMLAYATKREGKGILAIVSVDGDVEFLLPSAEGDVMEPAWSPFLPTITTKTLDL